MTEIYAMVYNGKTWNLTLKADVIETLYDDKKYYVDANLEEFKDSLSKTKLRALKEWVHMDDYDESDPHIQKKKEIKKEIELLLFNKKNIPINTKKYS